MSKIIQREPLPKTMKAVICHGPKDYRLEEVETPQAGRGEVVVKIHASGVCASDFKCYSGAPMFWGDENRKGYVDKALEQRLTNFF
jgi:NADPH:quinone reductase-like Zn-dependent oxidoreductase